MQQQIRAAESRPCDQGLIRMCHVHHGHHKVLAGHLKEDPVIETHPHAHQSEKQPHRPLFQDCFAAMLGLHDVGRRVDRRVREVFRLGQRFPRAHFFISCRAGAVRPPFRHARCYTPSCDVKTKGQHAGLASQACLLCKSFMADLSDSSRHQVARVQKFWTRFSQSFRGAMRRDDTVIPAVYPNIDGGFAAFVGGAGFRRGYCCEE
jgi:hypothetical protein